MVMEYRDAQALTEAPSVNADVRRELVATDAAFRTESAEGGGAAAGGAGGRNLRASGREVIEIGQVNDFADHYALT